MKKEAGVAAGVIVAVLVLIGAGIGLYFIASNDDDEAMEPETSQQEVAEPVAEAEEEESSNIVETAQATPSLSTLVTAVVEADLVETLSGDGPFTVLAPDNDAFAAAIEELNTTAEELLARDDLADILTYHVIAGNVMSTDLEDGQVVTTVQGDTLTVEITEEGVFFIDQNDRRAMVMTADIETSNGTVHIIDNVLLPGDGSGA